MSSKASFFGGKAVRSVPLLALLVAVGCDENGEFQMPSLPSFGSGESSASAAEDAAPAVTLVERDVEAPDVFSVSENGLWDGRPSLGGVWVAHPDVTDPERVIIRNQTNDEFVIGALFRRERENPGPALQVSSDAAEELGMLAGSPTLLSVIALRREEGPAEPTVEAETEVLGPPPAVEATTLDSAPAETTETAATQPPASAEQQASAEPADPVASAAAIAIAAAEAAGVGQSAEVTPTAPASAPAPAQSNLDKPFIQIGIFSVKANADRTADRLRSDGLLPTVREEESRGRTFWRVIVGPATTTGDRAAVLSKAKALGFTDAYFVSN